MDTGQLLVSLLHPPILFFFAGLLAARLGSDLSLPAPLPQLLSSYLLLAIGFRGGVELSHAGMDGTIAATLAVAVAFAVITPFLVYAALRRRFGPANAAGIAATYGSVSAVTFIAATSLLEASGIDHGGYMVAALALMESPAILVAVLLHRRAHRGVHPYEARGSIAREAFLNGSVFLLLASFAAGLLSTDAGATAMEPFTGGLFTGMLCLFLLEMGLASGRTLGNLRSLGLPAATFAVGMPMVMAAAAAMAATMLELGLGDAFLLCVLCASASYIAVPAALRQAIPEADPGVYLTMALAISFPFNLVIGLPLYLAGLRTLLA